MLLDTRIYITKHILTIRQLLFEVIAMIYILCHKGVEIVFFFKLCSHKVKNYNIFFFINKILFTIYVLQGIISKFEKNTQE